MHAGKRVVGKELQKLSSKTSLDYLLNSFTATRREIITSKTENMLMRFVLGCRMHLEFLPGRKAPWRRDMKRKKEPVTTGPGTEGSRQREPATESLEVGGSLSSAQDGRQAPGRRRKSAGEAGRPRRAGTPQGVLFKGHADGSRGRTGVGGTSDQCGDTGVQKKEDGTLDQNTSNSEGGAWPSVTHTWEVKGTGVREELRPPVCSQSVWAERSLHVYLSCDTRKKMGFPDSERLYHHLRTISS